MSAGAPGPQTPEDKLVGNIVFGIGMVLTLAFIIWAAVGFRLSQVVPLFLLGGLGAAGMWLGSRINKDHEPNKAVDWKRTTTPDSEPKG